MSSIVGRTKKNSRGEVVTITAFHNGKVDVQFDNGSRRRNVSLARFKQGKVFSLKCFIGQKRKNRRGEEVTIVRFRNWNSIDVQFSDGTVRKGVNYLNFRTGRVFSLEQPLDSVCIGELRPNTNREWMRIIDCRSLWDLTVQFRDGTVRKGIDYFRFCSCEIKK